MNNDFNLNEKLQSYTPSPNSKVKSYVNTTYTSNNKLSLYEKSTQKYLDEKETIYNIKIEGVTIVLKKGKSLYKQICDKRTQMESNAPLAPLRNLTITCDTLEIHDDLILPECNVSIFTRVLDIKKQVGIYTQPLKWRESKAPDANSTNKEKDPARNGVNGRNAGNVTIYANTTKGASLKIYANGGNGQGAGKGLKGIDGKSFKKLSNTFVRTHVTGIFNKKKHRVTGHHSYSDGRPVYYEYKYYHLIIAGGSFKILGSQANKPTSGHNAKKPGTPGEPANGGNIRYNFNLETSNIYCEGGTAGAIASNVKGGKAGTPRHASGYQIAIQMNGI